MFGSAAGRRVGVIMKIFLKWFFGALLLVVLLAVVLLLSLDTILRVVWKIVFARRRAWTWRSGNFILVCWSRS